MAKKETTKKTVAKKAKTERKPKTKVEEIEKVAEAPAIEVISEPEPIPTENQVEEMIEVMNGDPAVLTDPVTESGTVAEPLRAKQEEEQESVEESAPVEEIKPQKSIFRRMFGYIWNGQEMDY